MSTVPEGLRSVVVWPDPGSSLGVQTPITSEALSLVPADALLGERRHSARDVARGKPAPDVFLAAAAAEDIPPRAALVVEDSVPGVTAAVAAGMAVVGLDQHGDGAALRAAGARTIRHLDELRPLLEAAMRRAA